MIKKSLIYQRKYGVSSVLLFFLVYGIKLSFFFLAMSKIALLFLFCWYVVDKIKSPNFSFPKKGLYIFVLLVLLWIYSVLISVANGSNNFIFASRLIYLITEPLIGGAIFASFLIREKQYKVYDFLILLRNIGIIQACLTLSSYLMPELNMVYLDLLPNTGNIQEDNIVRVRGFSNLGGASLSVLLAISFLANLTLMDYKKSTNLSELFALLVILLSCIVVGRTGLLICLGFLGVHLIKWFLKRELLKRMWMVFLLVFLLSIPLYDVFNNLMESFDPETLSWAFEIFNKNNFGKSSSSDELGSMLFLPDNTIDLVFGSGLYHEPYHSYPRSDSGFVNTVLAVGLMGSLVFYGAYIYVFVNLSLGYIGRNTLLFFGLFFGSICMIVEIKEPFLQVVGLPIIIFVLFFLGLFEKKQNI